MTTQAQIDRSSHFTDLARFAAAFESEEVLRKTIETLLTKMPKVSGVQRTHGTQEYGKDLIFYGPGGLSETRLYACVVKNTTVTGNVDSNSGARAVHHQAEQALDTPFVNSKGDSERVEHAYVMCPHELSQTTMNSIAGGLKKGQVTFWCGRKLLKLFEDHWPEFLIFDSDLLPAYLNSLQAVLEKNTDLTNVVFRHSILGDVSKQLSDIYVKPRFKQDLQEFTLSETPIPNISEVEAPITLQRVKELADELNATGNVLDTLSIEREHVDATRTKEMAKELHSLATRLSKAWEDAYKPFKLRPAVETHKLTGGRRKIRYGTGGDELPGPKKGEMQLPLKNGKDLRELCDRIIQEATPIIEEFRARVSRSNTFVTGGHSSGPIEALQTEEYRLYCSVQENSRLNPKVLTAATVTRTLDFPEDLLRKHSGPLLIAGPAGFGKTTFCKWNTITDAEHFVKRESSVLPVFVPLHQFAQGPLASFRETFLRPPEIQRVLDAKKAEKDSTFRIRFYLDGLDEIPSVERQHELLELARTFMLSERNVDIILTAREHVFGLGWLSRVRLRELDQDGIRELVNKWLEHNESEIRTFFEQLSAVPSLDRLMEIPLLGTLIIAVYRKQKKLPESKIKLYEIFVELLSGGWDLAKDIKRETKFGPAVKLSVLAHLATVLHMNRKRQFEESVFKFAVKDTLPATAGQWEVLLNELIQDCLLSPVGCSYTFYHHSFQEYFAAKDLCDPSGKKQSKVLRWFLKGDDWWREVLGFYVGIAGNPADLKSWITTQVESVASLAAIDVSERQKYLHTSVDEYYPAASVAAT